MNHYDTLGIKDRACSAADIKHAYRRAAKAAHPDRAGGSTERMTAINRAYSILGDVELRRLYDISGDDAMASGADPRETQRQAAREQMMHTFLQAVMQCGEEKDPVKVARESFEVHLTSARHERESHKAQAQKLRAVLKRLTAKNNGDNFLAVTLQSQIDAIERGVAKQQQAMEGIELAMQMLNDYACPPDPKTAGSFARRANRDFDEVLMQDLKSMFGGRRGGGYSYGPFGFDSGR